jgi:RNA polymerase sigma-70 factor (ECF subfamily)
MQVSRAGAAVVEPTDHALLSGLHSGDERSFELLFHRHFASVYGVALRIVGDPSEAEELAHDAFIRLYERPIDPADEANVRGWLLRVVSNAAFNSLRSRRRRLGWLQRFAGRADARDRDDNDPADVVANTDESRQVRECLARLPERQRTALVLRFSGMSYTEIATALGISVNSVGTILVRAEKAFRTLYERDFGPKGGSRA